MNEISFSDQPMANPHLLPPLALAYLGDAVYEVAVRRFLLTYGIVRANQLHRQAIKYVRASTQAKVLFALEDKLTAEEQAVVKRGRNAKSHHTPKGSSVTEYRHSTAFECLVGYLYLKGDIDRLNQILQVVSAVVGQEKGE
ncbi:ribonuclease III domain-containing protein [Peptococcaceae bacterium 1198_IL3148]